MVVYQYNSGNTEALNRMASNGKEEALAMILSAVDSVRAEIAGLRADLASGHKETEFSENLPAAPSSSSSSGAAAGQGPVVRLENLARLGFGPARGKKERKLTTPGAAPRNWRLFADRVRALLREHGYPAKALGPEAIQFASSLKMEEPDFDAWSDEEILARRATWSSPEVSKGPRKLANMTPEELANAKARREEMKVAKAAGQAPLPVAAAAQPAGEFKPVLLGGIRYLINQTTGHAYRRNENGSMGEWAGIFVKTPKPHIDDSVPEPKGNGVELSFEGGKQKSTRKHKRKQKKTRKH